MAGLWCDGFDHYGNSSVARDNMLDGVYAQLGNQVNVSTSIVRTGTYSLRTLDGENNLITRRVFGGTKTRVGVGFGFYLSALPSVSNALFPFSFRDSDNNIQVKIGINTDGTITAYRDTTAIGTSDSPAVTAAAWQHMECWVTCDNSAGTVEVRVNGVTVLDLSSLDTQGQSTSAMTQWAFYNSVNPVCQSWIDDLFAADDSGSYNNDFIGDRRVLTQMPVADTAQADWPLSTGSDGYALIDDVSPDDDSSYIYAETSGLDSEFALDDLPEEVSAIAFTNLVHRSRKDEAGDCNVQTGMVSGGEVASGTDRAITSEYTYWGDVIELDPDTGAPFSRSGWNAATLRISRTA